MQAKKSVAILIAGVLPLALVTFGSIQSVSARGPSRSSSGARVTTHAEPAAALVPPVLNSR
jgi:hypothetical protein